jgi:hypothetical protein
MPPQVVGRARPAKDGPSVNVGPPTQSRHPRPVYDLYARAHVILTAREVVELLAGRVVGS